MSARLLALCAVLAATSLAGCGSLLGPTATPPHRFSLEGAMPGDAVAPPAARAPSAPVLVVTPPTAAPGFATDRMVYLRAPQEPQPYAENAWVESPPRMLAPLVVQALQRDPALQAVVASPTSAAGQVQLDTEVLALQHELYGGASRVRFALRVTIVDKRGPQQRVMAMDLVDAVPTQADNAAGFAHAARDAVSSVLKQLADVVAAQVRRPAGS